MFVPMYDHTGIFAVDKCFRDRRYASDKSKNPDMDYAFASLKPNVRNNVRDVMAAKTPSPVRPAMPTG
ncbi:hypothetical protein ABZ079_33335 [Streptomyces sp. NPDC006314]|uniref:hypothetical protein n=1 Tax=Streptomyces sp. NPDC006314 TaxID=3154475 RepID=UPI0033B10AE6